MTELSLETGDSVVLIVVVAGLLLDRALAIVFEHPRFLEAGLARHRYAFTLIAGVALAAFYRIDIFAMISESEVGPIGIALTGLFIAGASTATTRIVTDLFAIRSRAQGIFAAGRRG